MKKLRFRRCFRPALCVLAALLLLSPGVQAGALSAGAEPPAQMAETIPDARTPQAGGHAGWALMNLVLAVATALASLVVLLGREGERAAAATGRRRRMRMGVRALTLLPGLAAIILLILTEDMRRRIVFADRWTQPMALLALLQLLIVLLGAITGGRRARTTPAGALEDT